MDKNRQDEFDRRSEVFFFSPEYDEDAYYAKFGELYPGIDPKPYSPLYTLRREIRDFQIHKKWFPAIIFSDILLEGLVFNITSEQAGISASMKDYQMFFQNYFDYKGNEGLLVRQLRNARQHNFGQLLGRVSRNNSTKTNFLALKNDLESITKKNINVRIHTFKLSFRLSEGYTEVAMFNWLLTNEKNDYATVNVCINPKKYIEDLEKAIIRCKEDIKNNALLQNNFLYNLKIENWMRVDYGNK